VQSSEAFAMANDPRLRRVIEAVLDRSGWDSRAASAEDGFRMACAIYHGTYIAQVAQVHVLPNGVPRVGQSLSASNIPSRV